MFISKKATWWLPLIITILFISVLAYLSGTNSTTIRTNQEMSIPVDELSVKAVGSFSDEEDFIHDMAKDLRKRHLGDIDNILVMISLSDLRDFVSKQYIDNGNSIFIMIISKAFPDRSSVILNVIDLMDQYDDWFVNNLLTLNEMNVIQRKNMIWNKRRELFGADAEIIWGHELESETNNSFAMQEVINSLDDAVDIDMNERLFILKSTIDEFVANEQEMELFSSSGLIANVFFNLNSVQSDLDAMPILERRKVISDARRTLGFPEEVISRLEERDAMLDKRWENGYQYMAEKDRLSKYLSGEELDIEMANLRDKYFGREAETILREENKGFYRFERPRLYGQN